MWKWSYYQDPYFDNVFFQEQTKSEAEKLISDMTTLVTNHMRRQKELVCSVLIHFPFIMVSVSFLTY